MCNSDFGALNIERVTQAHFNEVKKFMTIDFLHNEPLSKSINLSVEESDGLFDDIIQAGIASSLSYLLRTPDGNIAALRLVSILDQAEEKCTSEQCKESPNDISDNMSTKTKKLSPKAQLIVNILHNLASKVWILIDPSLRRLLRWSILSVDKNYARRGLAEKLLTYNLDEAKKLGCQGCISEATAFNSQSLFKKLGYKTINEIRHDQWLDENGQQIFKCDDNTTCAQLVYKPL